MAIAIIQARMGSTRLPGKVLKKISNKPMLHYTIETLRLSPVVDKIIIATSNKIENDVIEDFAIQEGIICFRGDEDDVLKRFYDVSLKYPAKYYFRATADNPILDKENPKMSFDFLIENKLDYSAVRGLPIGTIVECFTKEALEKAHREAVSIEDREHVTLYMKRSKDFKIGYKEIVKNLCFPKMRLTVDYPEDFERVEIIISNLYGDRIPTIGEIIDFVNKSELL